MKVDVGAIYQGYHGDAAVTVPVGVVSDEARRLVEVTEEALVRGILAARAGGFLNDIGAAIEEYVMPTGFSIVRQYVGHGVGRQLHEPPNVAHYRQDARGVKLRPGMVLTIEPMINAGTWDTELLDDEWTVVTADGQLSAQFEHTVAITEDGPEILSIADNGETWSIPFSGGKKGTILMCMSRNVPARTGSGFYVCFSVRDRSGPSTRWKEEKAMKVSASVKRRCDKCRIIRRRGVIMVICQDPRHKQKQGISAYGTHRWRRHSAG